MLMSVQHDTGRWGSEYTLQTESGGSILGLRVLRNFGKLVNGDAAADETPGKEVSESLKRVDEEDAMEGGLKGRLSAGAELYVSSEKSAGGKLYSFSILTVKLTNVFIVSAAIRFTTLPDSALQTASSSKTPFFQPPTICTATFTPITGHLSAAYAAKVSRDLALCSRFTFNINSYESEWTMGGEWWLRRKKPVLDNVSAASDPPPATAPAVFSISEGTEPPLYRPEDEIQGVVKARLSTSSVSIPSLLNAHRI